MEYSLSELIDAPKLQLLLDSLYISSGIPLAVIDTNGQILAGAGWQEICTEFHRKHPVSEKACIHSDTRIAVELNTAKGIVCYECPHGLIDSATAIMVEGEHLGNVFTGQFFLEQPDELRFREQAAVYEFDLDAYLEALRKVPVITRERFEAHLSCISQLTEMVAELSSGFKRDKIKSQQIQDMARRYSGILETAMDGLWLVDKQGRILEVNGVSCTMSGYTCSELLQMTVNDLDAIETDEETEQHIERVMRNGFDRFETRHRRKDGTLIDVEVSVSVISEDGQMLVFLRDITENKLADEKLNLASQVYQSSTEAMVITALDGTIITVNPAFTDVTGYAPEEVIGNNTRILNSGHHDQAFFQDMWHQLSTAGCWKGEIWNRRKNGEIYPEVLSISTVFNTDGTPYRYMALFIDITEKKKSEEVIWQQANFDLLTGLPNRHMFQDRLDQELKKSDRAGLPLALLFLDLDHFKEINDTLGHAMGDILLREAAQRLSGCVRDTDTVARLGGDEFAIILGELEEVGSVERIAQNILRTLAEPFRLADETAYISASIGVTMYPVDSTGIHELIKNADQAMYAAKNQGRNGYNFFTPSMQEAAQVRMRLTNDLRTALTNHQFILYYQPIVELATGAIHKAEALIRWQHPKRGLVSPAEFISIAEETGLIVEIGNWVFHEAANQVARWRALHSAEFQISINKSPVQFHNKDNSHALWFDHLQELNLPGRSMVVEITEGLLLDASSAVSDKLLAFRDAGIRVSIDDFGTGYSSLSYLKKFSIDYLKIDQSFVRNMAPGSSDMALCEAIIVMAHKLGMKVIAEGVETAAQRDLLAAVGCDFAQGYLYSRPVPAEEFEALLKTLQPAG